MIALSIVARLIASDLAYRLATRVGIPALIGWWLGEIIGRWFFG